VDTSFPDPGRAARVRATGPAVDALFAEVLGELGAPGLAGMQLLEKADHLVARRA